MRFPRQPVLALEEAAFLVLREVAVLQEAAFLVLEEAAVLQAQEVVPLLAEAGPLEATAGEVAVPLPVVGAEKMVALGAQQSRRSEEFRQYSPSLQTRYRRNAPLAGLKT